MNKTANKKKLIGLFNSGGESVEMAVELNRALNLLSPTELDILSTWNGFSSDREKGRVLKMDHKKRLLTDEALLRGIEMADYPYEFVDTKRWSSFIAGWKALAQGFGGTVGATEDEWMPREIQSDISGLDIYLPMKPFLVGDRRSISDFVKQFSKLLEVEKAIMSFMSSQKGFISYEKPMVWGVWYDDLEFAIGLDVDKMKHDIRYWLGY